MRDDVEFVRVAVAWGPNEKMMKSRIDMDTVRELIDEGQMQSDFGLIKKEGMEFEIYIDEDPSRPSMRLKNIIIRSFVKYLLDNGVFRTTKEEDLVINRLINEGAHNKNSGVETVKTGQDLFRQIFEDSTWIFTVVNK